MKKITLFTVVLVLMSALCACGKREETKPTAPQYDTQPSTVAPSMMPEIDLTPETNIPDPTVNENSEGFGAMEEEFNDSTIETKEYDDRIDDQTRKAERTENGKTMQK